MIYRWPLLLLALCLVPQAVFVAGVERGAAQSAATKGTEENQGQASLKVVNQAGKLTAFSPKDFAKLRRQQVKAKDHLGVMATYEGAALADLLRAADVTLGKELKGPLLANCLLVEAKDGYRVVFSLPEIDPNMTDNIVLLADSKDGKALDAKEGPYRLVAAHDKQFMRWVKQVTQISVRATAEIPLQK
jgi:hypothetical protein